MKQAKPLLIEIVVGAVILGIGLLTNIDYYSSLLFTMGIALMFSSFVHLIRFLYWQSPKHKAEYEARIQEAHINSIDERTQFLRSKAGLITCQIMLFVLLILIVVLTLLRTATWVRLMIFLLLILQWIVFVVVFRALGKKM